MPRIYFAGPLFCQAECEYNVKVCSLIRKEGFDVFLPQEQPTVDELFCGTGRNLNDIMMEVFQRDVAEINKCDALLFLMDGRVPDEGACFELGYAYAKGKKCFALKTDVRTSEDGADNAMLVSSLNGNIAKDLQSLLKMLRTFLLQRKNYEI
ncbi:MAG: nucleoside 2-deoxyribosyltransferase [Candidatus Methanomethylophilaceae archaeon]|jgi:nucleoside 2-deoxyribosyltransferase